MSSGEVIRHAKIDDQVSRLKRLVLDSLTSPESKRSYAHSIDEFVRWHQSTLPGSGFTKATVNAYKSHLLETGLAASSINIRLTAVKKLAAEASDNDLMDSKLTDGISKIKGVSRKGAKLGRWLTHAQAEELINLPNLSTLKGKRDRALLALMVGSGLRRDEVASLEVGHIQMREARWLLVDVMGKGRKVRTVPIPAFAKASVDAWLGAAGVTEGRIFRPVLKGEQAKVIGDRVTAQAIFNVVVLYAKKMGLELAPHDLRRSFAKLAHRGKAPIDQISMSLGHSDIRTTQIYLGTDQDLVNAPCDVLNLKL